MLDDEENAIIEAWNENSHHRAGFVREILSRYDLRMIEGFISERKMKEQNPSPHPLPSGERREVRGNDSGMTVEKEVKAK